MQNKKEEKRCDEKYWHFFNSLRKGFIYLYFRIFIYLYFPISYSFLYVMHFTSISHHSSSSFDKMEVFENFCFIHKRNIFSTLSLSDTLVVTTVTHLFLTIRLLLKEQCTLSLSLFTRLHSIQSPFFITLSLLTSLQFVLLHCLMYFLHV